MPKTTLPAFAPVPRLNNRHDGWTPARQLSFIESLALYGSVRAAANAVGMTAEGAYLLRRHPDAAQFRAAWQAALDLGVQKIEDVAMERALNGIEVPVYSYGKLVGTRIKYNDRLLMFMLRNRAPKRFTEGGARGLNAVDKQSVAKLKKQWRKEWEKEHARAADIDEQATYDAITAKLTRAREAFLEGMSPATRAAYDEYQRLHAEDKATGYNPWLEKLALARREEDPDADPVIPLPPPGTILPGDRRPVFDHPPLPPGYTRVRSLRDEWE